MSYGVIKHMRDQFKVNVLAVEYPGYGLLSGLQPSEQGVYEVALTAFRYLFDEVKVRYSQIVLFGRSLGSGPAVHLAAQYPVGGLILVSAFSSIRGAVQSIAGSFLAWGVKEHFPNLQLISNVSCSTLIIHGESDGLIPVEHSLRLFKRCRARKLLATPPTMDHNSNLFADASYLAVPAIHFFGFPGFCTSSPPKLPTHLFEKPDQSKPRTPEKVPEDPACMRNLGLCGCLAKKDPHHLDVPIGSPGRIRAADITISFSEKNEKNAKHTLIDNNALAEVPASLQLDNLTGPPYSAPGMEVNDKFDGFYGIEDNIEKIRQGLGVGLKENIDEIQRAKRRHTKEI